MRSTSSLPRMSRTPIRRCCAFLKSCSTLSVSAAPRHSSSSVACNSPRVGSLSSCSESTSSSSMPGFVVSISDRYGLAAHSSHVQRQRRRIEAKQVPQHSLAAERVAHQRQVVERAVGVRRGADLAQQPRQDRGQQMPAAARGEKRHLLGGQRVAAWPAPPLALAKPKGASAARTSSAGGAGSSSSSTSRGGRRLALERRVEQLAEHVPAAGLRLLKRGGQAAGGFAAEPAGDRVRGGDVFGQLRRGRARTICRRVFQPPQRRVGVLQHLPLGGREDAGLGQPRDRGQRACAAAGPAHRRRTEAARTRPSLPGRAGRRGPGAGCASRPGAAWPSMTIRRFKRLEFPFRRPAEIAPKEPVLQPGEQRLAELAIARDRPGLEQRLAMPGAAEAVEADGHVLSRVRSGARRAVGQRDQADLVCGFAAAGVRQIPHQQLRGPLVQVLHGAIRSGVGLARRHRRRATPAARRSPFRRRPAGPGR